MCEIRNASGSLTFHDDVLYLCVSPNNANAPTFQIDTDQVMFLNVCLER